MIGRANRFGWVGATVALALFASACSSGDAELDQSATDAPTTTLEASDTVETAESTTTTAPPETSTAPEVVEFEAAFEAGDCEFTAPTDVTAECGWVEVPQQWDDPSDPDTIRLHVATFTNASTPPDATPVVYLVGGPGGDTFGLIDLTFVDQFGPIVDEHPMVLFTQRGSELSDVDLVCEEVIDLTVEVLGQVPDPAAELAQQTETLGECIQRLEGEGADLSAYHSVASANDVDAIRGALGHDQWNVLGISYGTRLGQELARTHPDGINALILDSVQPTDPALGSLAALPTTFSGSLDQLFAGCAANAECAAANPNLEERLRALVDQAEAEPFEVQAADQISGESIDAVVDGGRLLGAIFQAMYIPEAFAAMPEMVGQLEQGDTSTLASLIGLQVTNAPFISNGMYAAVMCHDFLAELTPVELFEAGRTGDAFFDDTFAGPLQDVGFCDVVPTGSAAPAITEPVQSDVPTLIMSGAYDPITPPSFAEAIAPGFSNGQVAVLPHAGHGVTGDESGAALAIGFFASPTDTIDTACIETSTEPTWIPASLAGLDYEEFELLSLIHI